MLKTFYGDAARIHTKRQTEVKKKEYAFVCVCVSADMIRLSG